MKKFFEISTENKASQIIKSKLKSVGGHAVIRTLNGKDREIYMTADGKAFMCPQLIPYEFEVFDALVDLMLTSPAYRVRKGNARSAKLGEPGCELDTAAGAILTFLGKKPGESGLDPIFIFAAVLEWAGIANNERGYISLKGEYIKLMR